MKKSEINERNREIINAHTLGSELRGIDAGHYFSWVDNPKLYQYTDEGFLVLITEENSETWNEGRPLSWTEKIGVVLLTIIIFFGFIAGLAFWVN